MIKMVSTRLALTSLIACVALAAGGCKKDNQSDYRAGSAAAQPAPKGADPAGGSAAPAGQPPANAADTQEKATKAAGLSTRIMIGVAGAVKAGKGNCDEMAKMVGAAAKAAEGMRIELMDLLADKAVAAEFKAQRDAGKFPDLSKDMNDAMAGAAACPDVFNTHVDRIVGEID